MVKTADRRACLVTDWEVDMGLMDKLKGTRPAKEGVAAVSVEELRAAVLGLNRDSAPWRVREAAPDEKCDLVAEWRIVDAKWSGIFSNYGLSKVFRVMMKFHEDEHEVRNVDEQASVSWRDGFPEISHSWSRGQQNVTEYGKGTGFTEHGEFGQVYEYKFKSNEIRDPLRDAVTAHGWGWKAVSFKL
jgi:hypothetical protein